MAKKEKNKLSALQKLSNVSGIPCDAALRVPYIRMCSNREILVEDAGKLLHYSPEKVSVMQKKLKITVTGKRLKLVCLTNNDLSVVGCIDGVVFEQVTI